MEKKDAIGTIPGLLLAIMVGIIAVELADLHFVIDALVIAIILGMILNFLFGTNEKLRPGVVLAPRIFIPLGIIFYAKNLDFLEFTKVSPSVLLQLVLIMTLAFLVIYWTGKKLGIKKKTALLTGTGTAVCGASAIAITSPVVEAEPEDMSVALVVITVAALAGILIFPTIMGTFSLSDKEYTVLAGSTLHMTGIVKTVVSGLSSELRDLAVSVKLMRVALLILIVPILSYVVRGRFYVHWFIIVFALLGIVFTYSPSTKDFVYTIVPFSEYFFPIALGSIGLNTDMKSVINSGVNPLIAGLLGFVAGVALFLLGTLIIPY
jgi:uncharacterized integral membrane protein (TIGR00698 family)